MDHSGLISAQEVLFPKAPSHTVIHPNLCLQDYHLAAAAPSSTGRNLQVPSLAHKIGIQLLNLLWRQT